MKCVYCFLFSLEWNFPKQHLPDCPTQTCSLPHIGFFDLLGSGHHSLLWKRPSRRSHTCNCLPTWMTLHVARCVPLGPNSLCGRVSVRTDVCYCLWSRFLVHARFETSCSFFTWGPTKNWTSNIIYIKPNSTFTWQRFEKIILVHADLFKWLKKQPEITESRV